MTRISFLPITLVALIAATCPPGAGVPSGASDSGGEEAAARGSEHPGASEHTRLAGDTALLGDGVVRAWAEIDDGGTPRAIGVTLPDSVIASVPDTGAMLSLELPPVDGLPFRHVLFDWGPEGHPPEDLYGVAHWDAHFYLITPGQRQEIGEGEVTARPQPALMPEGFIPVPRLGLYSFPEMGVHWTHEDAPELHGNAFDQTLIYGSTGDRTIFVEPMVTQAYLAGRPDVAGPIPWPAAVAEAGFYPTTYIIRHEPTEAGFRFSLEGFRWREADGGS